MSWLFGKKPELPTAEQALPGRLERVPVPPGHYVNGRVA